MDREVNVNPYRIAQIVEWNRAGQSCIALLRGEEVVGRFSNWAEARAAYAKAVQS